MSETPFKISKIDEFKHQVFGWASVALTADGKTIIDRQDHIIPPEELEAAVYEFALFYRDMDEKHTEAVQGLMIESFVATPDKLEKMGLAKDVLPLGWWVGFWVPDPDVFAKVISGQYSMFSISGSAVIESGE